MAKIIGILATSLFLLGCTKQYKYKIIGNIIVDGTLRDAVWYTDTISFNGDTAYYFNSDKSIVKIHYPYKAYEIY